MHGQRFNVRQEVYDVMMMSSAKYYVKAIRHI